MTVSCQEREENFYSRPFLTKTFSAITSAEIKKDFLYEWIVQEHLLRKYGEIFYWRNKYEIDVTVDGQRIEVKAGKPHRSYPRNVMILDEEKIPKFLLKL